ncbi:MAG: hypothetical protein U0936_03605 [Planctomycetaceae bacterium]
MLSAIAAGKQAVMMAPTEVWQLNIGETFEELLAEVAFSADCCWADCLLRSVVNFWKASIPGQHAG